MCRGRMALIVRFPGRQKDVYELRNSSMESGLSFHRRARQNDHHFRRIPLVMTLPPTIL